MPKVKRKRAHSPPFLPFLPTNRDERKKKLGLRENAILTRNAPTMCCSCLVAIPEPRNGNFFFFFLRVVFFVRGVEFMIGVRVPECATQGKMNPERRQRARCKRSVARESFSANTVAGKRGIACGLSSPLPLSSSLPHSLSLKTTPIGSFTFVPVAGGAKDAISRKARDQFDYHELQGCPNLRRLVCPLGAFFFLFFFFCSRAFF